MKNFYTWGTPDISLCPGKESTFEFLDDVIAEVVELFPSEYIHIGGDECRKARWEKCPLCQNLLTGDGEEDYCPKLEIKTKKRIFAFRIVMFTVFSAIIINVAMDFLFLNGVHPSWSPLVAGWLLAS